MMAGAAWPALTGEGTTEAAGSAPMVTEATKRGTAVAEVEVEAATVVEPIVAVTTGSPRVSVVADEVLFMPPPKGDAPKPRETPNDSLVDTAALLDRAIVWTSLSEPGAAGVREDSIEGSCFCCRRGGVPTFPWIRVLGRRCHAPP